MKFLKIITIPVIFLILFNNFSCGQSKIQTTKKMKYNKFTPAEKRVIINKGTEAPFSGIYEKHYQAGTYLCKQCDAPLYR